VPDRGDDRSRATRLAAVRLTTLDDWRAVLKGEWPMSPLLLILIILLIVLLFGGGYGYRSGIYNRAPYYGPGIGIIGIIVLVLIVLALTGRL
jgi:hypothetical protein